MTAQTVTKCANRSVTNWGAGLSGRSLAISFLAALLLLAAVGNGASAYLKRLGAADPDLYRDFWSMHCADQQVPGQREWQCARFTTEPEILEKLMGPESGKVLPLGRIYEVAAAERPLKLLKDFFFLLLLACCAIAWRQPPILERASTWPLFPILVYVAGAALWSLVSHSGWLAAAGARGFMFLALAGLCRPLQPLSAKWLVAIAGILAIQVAVVPFEIVLGVHEFMEWAGGLSRRAAGTLVAPNTLGVFAACSAAFLHAFAPNRRLVIAAVAASAFLVAASASGTGVIALAMLGGLAALPRVPPQRRALTWFAMVGLGLALLIGLPRIVGRPELFESVTGGRLQSFAEAFSGHGWLEIIFGRGLGVNTNLALNLAATSPGTVMPLPTDSLLTGLLIQLGVAGTLLFYGTWAWLAWRDPRARPFHLVSAVCSLTLNITEVFPVNFMAGLVWGHSLYLPESTPTRSTSDG